MGRGGGRVGREGEEAAARGVGRERVCALNTRAHGTAMSNSRGSSICVSSSVSSIDIHSSSEVIELT